MESVSDIELIAQIKKGSSDGFEALYFKYFEPLCRYSLLLLRNKHNAEEIVQEVFFKLWEKRERLIIETSVKAYLFKATHNLCLNFIEHQKVVQNYHQHFLKENIDLISPVSGDYPIANLLSKEIGTEIKKAIQELPDQCREIFINIRHFNLSYAETAEKLGISVNTVKTQLQRAISKLRESLREYLPK